MVSKIVLKADHFGTRASVLGFRVRDRVWAHLGNGVQLGLQGARPALGLSCQPTLLVDGDLQLLQRGFQLLGRLHQHTAPLSPNLNLSHFLGFQYLGVDHWGLGFRVLVLD